MGKLSRITVQLCSYNMVWSVAKLRIHMIKNSSRAREYNFLFLEATQEIWFLGEYTGDGLSKVITHCLKVAVVDQMNKTSDCLGVQQISSWRSVFPRPFINVVQTTDNRMIADQSPLQTVYSF